MEKRQLELFEDGLVPNSFLSEFDLNKIFTQVRHSNPELDLYPRSIDKGAMKRVANAYSRYMNHSLPNNYPVYKTERSKTKSYSLRTDKFYIDHDKARVDGLGRNHLVYLGFDTGLDRSYTYFNPTVVKDYFNQYWICFSTAEDKPVLTQMKTEPIGIDLNARDDARIVLSNGIRFCSPENFRNALRNVNNSQIKLRPYIERQRIWESEHPNEPYPMSNSELKIREIYLKRYAKVKNLNDYFYDTSIMQIINTNPAYIVIEDLNVTRMKKKHYIADDIHHAAFRKFREIITYRCDQFRIPLYVVPETFESSKTCCNCGYTNSNFKDQLIFNCPQCGASIDRDVNAAINIRNYYYLEDSLDTE
jgi:putative transposase